MKNDETKFLRYEFTCSSDSYFRTKAMHTNDTLVHLH